MDIQQLKKYWDENGEKLHTYSPSHVDKTSDDFTRRKFTDIEFEQLKGDFKNIDITFLSDNSFWAAELDDLLWERDDE